MGYSEITETTGIRCLPAATPRLHAIAGSTTAHAEIAAKITDGTICGFASKA